VLALGDLVLLPRHARRNEDDLVEVERLSDLARRDEVSVVDGSNVPPMTPMRGARSETIGLPQWWPWPTCAWSTGCALA
jgi:hypothetical protein